MQEHYVPSDDAYSSYAIPLRDAYEYDALNRVTQANGVQRTTGGAWPSVYAQHFSYDRWGNRWINSGGTWGANIFNTVILPNSANNRLNGMTYDSAGNTTTDNITGGGARTYDADNKDHSDGWTAVDPQQWRVVKLLMRDPKGSEDVYEIELLRSLEWIRKVGAAPRRFINHPVAR